ncbi:ATP-binding protein [Candidatus Woesearchaeota archaeon]|nr:ATP-binding protein [Candidatus Woesearchaeota archaeon]
MYDIVIGRDAEDTKKYGDLGTIFIGKHYVKMGQTTSLSNRILIDVARSHVVFVCGKRGSGKSYTMGVIAESMLDMPEEIRKNLSIIILDTMGIYWTMKYPNKEDKKLLEEWGLEARGLKVNIFTPSGYYKKFKEEGIPTDFPFSIKTSELSAYEWCETFGVELSSSIGILIERVIEDLRESKEDYDVGDIIKIIHKDERSTKEVKDAAENRFLSAKHWGLFSKKGSLLEDLVIPGQITVLDVSCYVYTPGAQSLRALVIGLVSQKLFAQRMVSRKGEEYEAVYTETHLFGREGKEEKKEPLVWLIIDEAHEFIPNDAKTVATQPLITLLREGRQPGISLVLASQQPGKIHNDVITQSDIVIAHRVTAKIDTQALGSLMQSYMRESLDKQLNYLPRVKGAALIFDDINEKIYSIRVRPRYTWHGGETPSVILKKKKIFEL